MSRRYQLRRCDGVQFTGIERRIRAAALVVADGGLVTHSTQSGSLGFLASMSCVQYVPRGFATWYPIEPVRFIGFAKPTPLLFQNGQTDPLIPSADAQALHNAAPEPKTILWYNAGHGLTPQPALDRHDWLVQQIGLDPR